MPGATNTRGMSYFWKAVCIVSSVYLLPFFFLKLKENASITEHLETEYLIIYGLLLLATLIPIRNRLALLSHWKVLVTGAVVAFVLAFPAMFLATVLGLNDGWERFANSYSFAGITGILTASGLYALVSGAWLAGVCSYWLVWKYAYTHHSL